MGKETILETNFAANFAIQITVVSVEDEGQRLDNFLFTHLKGVPKSHIYRIIRSGEVRVNKGRVRAHYKLCAEDSIRLPPIRMAEKKSVNIPSTSREFEILFEDEGLLVINKPAGVAVHGGSGVDFGVIEQLRAARPGALVLELVHRLDKETSGVLLIAKKKSVLRHLQEQLRERQTQKIYWAVALGHMSEKTRVIKHALHKYLLENGERRVKVVAGDHVDAMASLTWVKCLATSKEDVAGKDLSWLEVDLKTGRTHQIRVHLAFEKHALIGDDKYGDFNYNKRLAKDGVLNRMALHAYSMRFENPRTRKKMQIVAPPPLELNKFLKEVFPLHA